MPYLHRREKLEYRTWSKAGFWVDKNKTSCIVLTKWLMECTVLQFLRLHLAVRWFAIVSKEGKIGRNRRRQEGKLGGTKEKKKAWFVSWKHTFHISTSRYAIMRFLSDSYNPSEQMFGYFVLQVLRHGPSLWATRPVVTGTWINCKVILIFLDTVNILWRICSKH
jgi:hypothetical protein